MKILKLSDIHQYSYYLFTRLFSCLPKKELYDIVVIAGDMTNGDLNLMKQIIDTFEKPVYFVLGNHDYLKHSIDHVVNFCLENNLNLLYGSNEYKINFNNKVYTLIGGTGWSSFSLYNTLSKYSYKKIASNSVIDFNHIYSKDNILITPNDYEKMHNKEWSYFSEYKDKENVILITHFPMSKVCLDPQYEHPQYRNLNPYFINNKNTTGFKLILSGHTHTCIDTFDQYGCRHIVNAYGYESEFNRLQQKGISGSNGFNSYKIIDVEEYFNG